MRQLLLAVAVLGTGCCLSTGVDRVVGANGTGQGTAGQGTSGQGTSGQSSGGQASNAGSATGGVCSGGGTLVVKPNPLDFGPTLINTTAKRTVTLTNCSTAAVTGITAQLMGYDANLFVVDNAPATLEAGASEVVDISFSPLAVEVRAMAFVRFSGSDGEEGGVNLFGETTGLPLSLAPSSCDFGYVPLNTTAICCTTASNETNVTVNISGVTAFANEAGAFAVATTDDDTPPNPFSLPISVAGGASANVCFSFTPSISQQYNGTVTLVTDDPTGANPTLTLTGWGGGPQISCTPTAFSFGQIADHNSRTVPIICTNVGTAIPSTNLIIDPPTASPDVFSAQFDPQSDVYPLNGLAPQQSTQIDATYTPTGTSNDKGTLFIKNNGGKGQTLEIPLTGQGEVVSACNFDIAPPSLDFGNLTTGDSLSLAFDVTNTGTDVCLVNGPRLGNNTSGSFRIVSTSIQPDPGTGKITIPVSSSLTVTVEFSAIYQGDFSAEVLFSVSVPIPNQTVELTGTSESSCLQFDRTTLDFGQVGMNDAGGFASQGESFAVTNDCQTSDSIAAIKLQNGPGDVVAQYSAPIGAMLPFALLPGAQTGFNLDCQPTTAGQHPAQILVSDGNVETLLPLICDAQ